MPALQRRTPQEMISIKSFTVLLEDGTTKTIEVADGAEGYFLEEHFVGPTGGFRTFKAFIAEAARTG